MTRKQACTQAAEAAVDWVHLISRFSEDPSGASTDASEFEDLSTKIGEALPHLPKDTKAAAEKLIDPLDAIYGVLVTGENTTIELENARNAVPDAMQCAGKGSLKGYQSQWEQ
ncbi:hypothetical protein [Actinoplanes sp. NPDC049118]|uniref:hypothetical protein n=1 Tax=Actinoplanes sp. NPDC049118 TaxID=3155769 RepID=UPI0033EEEDB8